MRPGDRLLLVGKATRLNRRQTIFNVQGFVGTTMVFHADIIGVPLCGKSETVSVRRRAGGCPWKSCRLSVGTPRPTRDCSLGGQSSAMSIPSRSRSASVKACFC